MGELTKMPRITHEVNNEIIQSNKEVTDEILNLDKVKSSSVEDHADATLAAYGQLAHALSALAGDNKELAAAGVIIDTYAGAQKALNATGTPLDYIHAASIIASGMANLQKIYAVDVGNSTSAGNITGMSGTPRAEMMSGSFDLTGGMAPEPLRAYVVTDEMTESQDLLASIRRRATI